MGSLQKPFSGGSRPLGTKCNQEKCQGQTSIWFFSDFLSQLRGSPSCKESSGQEGLWIHHFAGHWGLNAKQALQNQHFMKKV